jgi:putative transposase
MQKKVNTIFLSRNIKIQFSETHVKVEGFTMSRKQNQQKLNWIKLAEKNRIPIDTKYSNPRITFDGLNWYISVGRDCNDAITLLLKEGIGIDLGIKDLAICSNRNIYKNINKTRKVKKINKKQRRLRRKISKK